MAKFKRVFSAWTTPVQQLSIAHKQSRVVDGSMITPAIMRQYGSKLIVLDEASRALEHCGQEINIQFLKSCRPRMNKTDNSAPAVQAVYRLTQEPEAVEELGVVEEFVAEFTVEPVTTTTIEDGEPVTVVTEVVAEDVEVPKVKKPRKKKTIEPDFTEE